MKLLDHQCLWDATRQATAGHCAFGDLIRMGCLWLAVFREGDAHVSEEAGLRLLWRRDAEVDWSDAGLLVVPGRDLRDPHFSLRSDGQLMLTAASVDRRSEPARLETLAWSNLRAADGAADPVDGALGSVTHPSSGGRAEAPVPQFDASTGRVISQPGHWLWRLVWHGQRGYGFGYGGGLHWYQLDEALKPCAPPKPLLQGVPANESGLCFDASGRAYVLLRQDRPRRDQRSSAAEEDAMGASSDAELTDAAASSHALFGIADPPYAHWTWQDFGQRIGGPSLIWNARGDGFYCGYRAYADPHEWEPQWTEVAELDLSGRLKRRLRLPSGGDCSYPGLVLDGERLHCLYYSSHESARGTSIYLAEIDLS